ncbi:MAG: hypothetical protein C4297_12080 [Gemmataceae bacterium]
MRNLVFIAFLALFAFVVAGWFLDWYQIRDFHSDNGKHRVQIEVDTQKIKEDLSRGRTKLQETWDRLRAGEKEHRLPGPVSQVGTLPGSSER